MEAIVLRISAPYAYFRVPYSTTGGFSYPFPPRTTVFGILASILGIPREKLWKNPLFEGKVGIRLNGIPKSVQLGVLIPKIKEKIPKISSEGPSYPEEGMRLPRQVLKNPKYEIYYSGPQQAMEKFEDFFFHGKSSRFHLYLGSSEMLAKVEYLGKTGLKEEKGEFETKFVLPVKASKDLEGKVPTYQIIHDEFGKYFLYRIPYAFEVIKTRKGEIRMPKGSLTVAISSERIKAAGGYYVADNGEAIILI